MRVIYQVLRTRGAHAILFAHAATALVTGTATTTANADAARGSLFVTPSAAHASPPRELTARDLLELREIAGLSVSPDGRYVAFEVQQADLEANHFRAGWYVAETTRPSVPVHVGDPGQPIWISLPNGRNPGAPFVLTARWSPDSQWIAYLCRERADVQICRSRRDGRRRERLTEVDADVDDLVWSADGARIIFALNRARVHRRMLEAQESEKGLLLDDRFDVFHSWQPVRYDVGGMETWRSLRTLDLRTRIEREASSDEVAWFETARPSPVVRYLGSQGTTRLPTMAAIGPKPTLPPSLSNAAASPARFIAYSRDRHRLAWLAPVFPEKQGLYAPLAVFAGQLPDRPPRQCQAAECTGFLSEAWWSADNREVFFLKREGWAFSRSALYAWATDTDRVRLLVSTPDLLSDCAGTPTHAICFHETATRPRRIAAIDLQTGRLAEVLDPNLQYRNLIVGPAELLEWKTPGGDQAFGYLVKPSSHDGRTRLPLVVVQYRATGFLKGGVGDEYPIQLLAANGFAVLVFDKPNSWETFATESVGNAIEAAEWRDLAERRRALSALEAGIDVLERKDLIDPCRVGITGLSDGAETATFALIHSKRFTVAATSSGGWDPIHYYLESGQRREALAQRGLGPPGTLTDHNWQHVSLSLNAPKIHVPLLVHVADRELLLMMQLYATFKDLHKPIEVYVFPDEYHQKWQPKHRLSIYQRNLDWFRFWLQNNEDPAPLKQPQYMRWREMKQREPKSTQSSGCTPAESP